MTLNTKICQQCGNIIHGQGKKFCSLHCWAIWANKTYKKLNNKPVKYCIHCGKIILKYGIKFCCIRCSVKYNNKFSSKRMTETWERRPRPFHSVETREKIRQIDLKLWANKEWAIQKQKTLRLAQQIIPNNKEKLLQNILDSVFPDTWIFIGDGKIPIGGKHPDFYDKSTNLIDLYGDYWHRNHNPQDRIDYFKQIGYNCLVIWEHELQDKNKLTEKIINWYPIKCSHQIELGQTAGELADSGILSKWVQQTQFTRRGCTQ